LEWDRRLVNVISPLTLSLSHRGRGNKTKIFDNNKMKIRTKLMFIRYGKNERGQVLVETAIVILVILVLLFGIMELALIGTVMIVANDAAYSVARAEVVEKRGTTAGGFVMLPVLTLGVIPIKMKGAVPEENRRFQVVESEVKYVKLLYRFLWSPIFTGTVTCKMVKSPDREFYDKSFER